MPAIAGVLAENFTCRPIRGGLHECVQAHGITVWLLHHRKPPTTASTILDAYRAGGVVAVHERDADCAVILFDESRHRLVLSRDRIGVHPIYYTRGAHFCFATFIADVLRGSAQASSPNRGALARLLVHGAAAPLGATYFDDVESLRSGATLVVTRDGVREIEPAAWLIPQPPRSFADAAAHFAALFQRSVQLRADDNTAVLVSGGLDSAAIICSADPQHTVGICYGATDGSPADESRYLEVLRAHGYRIDRIPFTPITGLAAIEANVRASELPFVDDVAATLERAAQHARDQAANVLLIGTWGDQVLAPFPPPHLTQISPGNVLQLARDAKALQRFMTDVPLQQIMLALLRQSLRRRAPRRLLSSWRRRRRTRSAFDELAHDYPAHDYPPSATTYAEALWQNVASAEQVEAIAATSKWGFVNGVDVRLPFLDVELLRWLRSLPDEIVYHRGELKPLLRAGMRGVVPEEVLQRRDKGDYTEAIRQAGLPIAQLVEPLDGLRRMVDFGLISRPKADRTLAKITRPANISNQDVDLAGYLLGVDVWLRVFFEAGS